MHVHRPFRATGFLALFLASLGITSSRAQEGACCKPDESCVVIPPGQCQVLGGYYLGDGTTCDPDPCGIPFGACCFPGYCIMTLEPDCNDQSGLFMGDGTRCDFNPCPPPTGACCTAGVCDVRTQDGPLNETALYFSLHFVVGVDAVESSAKKRGSHFTPTPTREQHAFLQIEFVICLNARTR